MDGAFGASQDGFDVYLSEPDAEYFAKFMAPNLNGAEYGFVTYAISANAIQAQTNFDGSFKDSFQIGNRGILGTLQLFFSNNLVLTSTIVLAIIVSVVTVFLVYSRRKAATQRSLNELKTPSLSRTLVAEGARRKVGGWLL